MPLGGGPASIRVSDAAPGCLRSAGGKRRADAAGPATLHGIAPRWRAWKPRCEEHHCHPNATEIYFCFQGGGQMRTLERTIDVTPGSFVVHPRGELHEFINGPERTLLYRVRYGDNMAGRRIDWRGNPDWQQSPEDAEYFREHPVG